MPWLVCWGSLFKVKQTISEMTSKQERLIYEWIWRLAKLPDCHSVCRWLSQVEDEKSALSMCRWLETIEEIDKVRLEMKGDWLNARFGDQREVAYAYRNRRLLQGSTIGGIRIFLGTRPYGLPCLIALLPTRFLKTLDLRSRRVLELAKSINVEYPETGRCVLVIDCDCPVAFEAVINVRYAIALALNELNVEDFVVRNGERTLLFPVDLVLRVDR